MHIVIYTLILQYLYGGIYFRSFRMQTNTLEKGIAIKFNKP